jgi:DNA-binding NarL/FixJ family response regulator
MTTVLSLDHDSPNTTVLNDPEAWAEIHRSALALAKSSIDHREINGSVAEVAESMTIGGAAYFLRQEVSWPSNRAVVLVAIERCLTDVPRSNTTQSAGELTRTEAVVAELLAQRKRNREIAEQLSVTEHTARRHTEHVLKKLGVHSRADVRAVLAGAVSVSHTH